MIQLLRTIIPYPFSYNNSFVDGYILMQPRDCKKCSKKGCIEILSIEETYLECPQGYSCISLRFNNESLFINGLVHWPNNKVLDIGKK